MLPKGRLRPVRIVREKVIESVVKTVKTPIVGPEGRPGRDGFVPAHRWVGDELQFQNPDGSWGKKRNLQGPTGFVGGGSSAEHFKYFAVETATYTISNKQLVPGINIFGVRYEGAVTITLPENLSPNDKTIIINDETGNAATNNITVQVP